MMKIAQITRTCLLLITCCSVVPALGQTQVQIGSGSTTNGPTEYPSAYPGYGGSVRTQFLVRASELREAGLSTGSFTQVAFRTSGQQVGGAPLLQFRISVGYTTADELGSTFVTGLKQIFGPVDYIPQVGWNNHLFSEQLGWDGEKNLVFEVCYNNNSPSANAQTFISTTSFNSTNYKAAAGASQCGVATGATALKSRPQMLITWIPPGQIGGGTLNYGEYGYPAPYGNWFWGARHQILYTKEELKSAGLSEGFLKGIAFNVIQSPAIKLEGFTVKIGTTPSTTLFGFEDESNFTTVWGPADYTDQMDWNWHDFKTPFYWDGNSNIILQTCFNNDNYTMNAPVYLHLVPNQPRTALYFSDWATVCTDPNGYGYTERPNTRFKLGKVHDHDIVMDQILEPKVQDCSKNLHEVKVIIYNGGKQPLQGVVVKGHIKGDSTQINFKDSIKNSIPAFTSDTLLLGYFNSAKSKNWKLTTWVQHTLDSIKSNDTLIRQSVIDPSPRAGFSFGGNGLTVNFTAVQPGLDVYFWEFGDDDVSVEENPTHTYAAAGTYEVKLTTMNPCGTDTMVKMVTVPMFTGISNVFAPGFNIQPNPVADRAHVRGLEPTWLRAQVEVVDLQGRVVQVFGPGSAEVRNGERILELGQLRPGTYALRLSSDLGIMQGGAFIKR